MAPAAPFTEAHMLVLAWINDHPIAFPEEIATAIGLSVASVEVLCDDLAAADMIERAPRTNPLRLRAATRLRK